MQIAGTVTDGKLVFHPEDQKRYLRYIARTPEGTIYKVELEKLYATRSILQNRFYWGCVVEPLRHYLGVETPEMMHEILKQRSPILAEKIRLNFDKRRRMVVVRSTAELTTVRFEEYLQEIRDWAKLPPFNFKIPLPNEVPEYYYDAESLQLEELTAAAKKR